MFVIEKYRGRWAVLDLVSGCFYFPEKPGKKNAQRYAARLNNDVPAAKENNRNLLARLFLN